MGSFFKVLSPPPVPPLSPLPPLSPVPPLLSPVPPLFVLLLSLPLSQEMRAKDDRESAEISPMVHNMLVVFMILFAFMVTGSDVSLVQMSGPDDWVT